MLHFDAQTWVALAGAAYAASAPVDQPGVHVERFVPGKGLVVERVVSRDAALDRTGLNRRLPVLRRAAKAPDGRVLRYDFGKRAVALTEADLDGRLRPGPAVVGLVERRNFDTGYCAVRRVCDNYPAMRRLSLGFGYGDADSMVAVAWFNDRIRLQSREPFEVNGAQLSLTRLYEWRWSPPPYAKP